VLISLKKKEKEIVSIMRMMLKWCNEIVL